jgi:hypothetical protein
VSASASASAVGVGGGDAEASGPGGQRFTNQMAYQANFTPAGFSFESPFVFDAPQQQQRQQQQPQPQQQSSRMGQSQSGAGEDAGGQRDSRHGSGDAASNQMMRWGEELGRKITPGA